jgi:hypothetical protein
MHEHDIGTSFEGPGITHTAIMVTTHNNTLDYTPVKRFTIKMSLD